MKYMNNMKSVKSLEKQIEAVEKLRVVVRYSNGRDVRSDKLKMPSYPYKQARKGSSTVRELQEARFHKVLPGYNVDVLDPSRKRGKRAHGRTLLRTIRERQDALD